MPEAERRVNVELMGKTFTIKGDADPEYMATVAGYVNNKIAEMRKLTSSDQVKMLLLTALNLADELFQARKGIQVSPADAQQIEKRTQALLKMLETGIVGQYSQTTDE
ncbi:MAG: cell division protein ZapA [Leptospiraceae bacterium]|nr:cell division protein ZapA [Leptospiraceae bacterium]